MRKSEYMDNDKLVDMIKKMAKDHADTAKASGGAFSGMYDIDVDTDDLTPHKMSGKFEEDEKRLAKIDAMSKKIKKLIEKIDELTDGMSEIALKFDMTQYVEYLWKIHDKVMNGDKVYDFEMQSINDIHQIYVKNKN